MLIQLRRRAEALRVFQNLEQVLRDELSVEPSERTRELQRLAATPDTPPASRHAVFQCSYTFPEPKQLIARENEIERLKTILDRGRTTGQLVLISAPAGTGKSTLAGALVKLARRSGFLCLAGAAYDERSAVPLAAFQEALTDYLLATAARPVDAAVSAATAELVEARRELRQHPSVSGSTPLDASAERSRLFAAILALLRALAEQGPVLVCLENLHIAGEATLHLLHYLVRQTRHAPVVFVATLRSEALQPGEPMAQVVAGLLRERLAEHLELPALDQPATDRLVALLVDGPVSSSLTASVYASTDGNPLFVEQLVLALRDAGRLDGSGRLSPRAVADVSTVPVVVRELIGERLARLNPRSRQTLETAAVLGHAFDYATLLAVIEPPDEATLLTDLDEAIQAQLLRERPGRVRLQPLLDARGGLLGPEQTAAHAAPRPSRRGAGAPRWRQRAQHRRRTGLSLWPGRFGPAGPDEGPALQPARRPPGRRARLESRSHASLRVRVCLDRTKRRGRGRCNAPRRSRRSRLGRARHGHVAGVHQDVSSRSWSAPPSQPSVRRPVRC